MFRLFILFFAREEIFQRKKTENVPHVLQILEASTFFLSCFLSGCRVLWKHTSLPQYRQRAEQQREIWVVNPEVL